MLGLSSPDVICTLMAFNLFPKRCASAAAAASGKCDQ